MGTHPTGIVLGSGLGLLAEAVEAQRVVTFAAAGLPAVRERVAGALKAALAGSRSPQSCELLAGRIGAVAKAITPPKERSAWADGLLQTMIGHEEYLPAGARKTAKKKPDPCAALLYKLAGKQAEAKAREAAANKVVSDAAGQDLSKNPQPPAN